MPVPIYLITTPLRGCCTGLWVSANAQGIKAVLNIAVVWRGVKELSWYLLGAAEQIFM